jgi:hypothetical protein
MIVAANAGNADVEFTAADLRVWRAAVCAYLTECARHARLPDLAQPCQSLARTYREQCAWVRRWLRSHHFDPVELDKLRLRARKELTAAVAALSKLRCQHVAAQRAEYLAGHRYALAQAGALAQQAGALAQLALKEDAASAKKFAQERQTACVEARYIVTDAKCRVDALDSCVLRRESQTRRQCKPRARSTGSTRDMFNAVVQSLGPVGTP